VAGSPEIKQTGRWPPEAIHFFSVSTDLQDLESLFSFLRKMCEQYAQGNDSDES
jgi:hypothetical protein